MLKMNATPGGGYWLEVEGNRFEVVLDQSEVEGVYGGLIKNRQYFCVVNGKRLGGGPYDRAQYAKNRLEPIIDRVKRRAEIDRERAEFRAMAEKLFPGGLPEVVLSAIDNYPTTENVPEPDPVAAEVEAETEPDPEPDAESVPVEETAPETPAEDPTPAQTAAAVRNSAAPAKRSRAKSTTTPAKDKATKDAEKKTTTRRRSTKAEQNGTPETTPESTEPEEVTAAAK